MNNIFIEKYAAKDSITKLNIKYCHESQTNKPLIADYKVEATQTRVHGEVTDYDELFNNLGVTPLTETGGEETDSDDLMKNAATRLTDVSGESTDKDWFYFMGQTKTAVDGEAEESEIVEQQL